MTYHGREVFPATPLALVAAEVVFNDAPRLRSEGTLDAIAIALESDFPRTEVCEERAFNMLAPDAPPHAAQGRIFKNHNSTAALTLFPTRLVYETTSYSDFPEFLRTFLTCCDVLVAHGVQSPMERVGLRYIDEVRVPTPIHDARDWGDWIDKRLVEHLDVGPSEHPVTTLQGLTTYDLGNHRGLTFRFGAMKEGMVVATKTLTRAPLQGSPEDPFFVLDFDGFEVFSGPEVTPLRTDIVGRCLEAVHAPAGATFQRAITDKARQLFRGGFV